MVGYYPGLIYILSAVLAGVVITGQSNVAMISIESQVRVPGLKVDLAPGTIAFVVAERIPSCREIGFTTIQ